MSKKRTRQQRARVVREKRKAGKFKNRGKTFPMDRDQWQDKFMTGESP